MVAAMDAELARIPSQAIELGGRQRDVRVLTEVVVLTEQRLRQEELRQALTFREYSGDRPSEAPLSGRSGPVSALGLAVGLMIAGVFGALALVVSERSDPSIRSVSGHPAPAGSSCPGGSAPKPEHDGTFSLGCPGGPRPSGPR